MKILFINPPAENEIVSTLPEIVTDEQGCYPPLGILYIASYMEKNTTHNVEILDAQAERIDYPEMEKIIQSKNPDVVGITVMTFTLVDVVKTVKIVKRINEGIRLVLGGPHVNIYPDENIDIPGVDFLVLGEGEVAFSELIKNIDSPECLERIKGLVFKHNGRIINTGVRELIDNLDGLPFPARHLTSYKKYYSLMAKRNPITTMFTSRGCPYRCSFCNRPHLGKKFRSRSAKNVVDEMEECVEMSIKEILIYDDTFTVNRSRVMDICNEIIKREINICWDIRTRVDIVDEEMLKKLKAANCERIHYGVEAGSDEIIKVLKKGITIDQVKNAFNLTRKVGISTLAYFMIGSPTEKREDIVRTIELAKELDPDFAHFTILCPYPATKIYEMAIERGILKIDYWREFAKNPSQDFEPFYWEETFNREELQTLRTYAYKSFYIRPSYIIKKLLKVRSIGEFKRTLKAGLKVLGMSSIH